MSITRRNPSRSVELVMTPMIDVVFQLLVFFLITFKVVAPEGDFDVKMPQHGSDVTALEALPPMTLHLAADERGELTKIQLNDISFGRSYDQLHNYLLAVLETNSPGGMREQAELEIQCDGQLRYEYVVHAITAVNGHLDAAGNKVTLMDHIRLTPPRVR